MLIGRTMDQTPTLQSSCHGGQKVLLWNAGFVRIILALGDGRRPASLLSDWPRVGIAEAVSDVELA